MPKFNWRAFSFGQQREEDPRVQAQRLLARRGLRAAVFPAAVGLGFALLQTVVDIVEPPEAPEYWPGTRLLLRFLVLAPLTGLTIFASVQYWARRIAELPDPADASLSRAELEAVWRRWAIRTMVMFVVAFYVIDFLQELTSGTGPAYLHYDRSVAARLVYVAFDLGFCMGIGYLLGRWQWVDWRRILFRPTGWPDS